MLNTSSIILNGTESFKKAYDSIPENKGLIDVRYLRTPENEETGIFQIKKQNAEKWSGPIVSKRDKAGNIIPLNTDTKGKLSNAKIFYDLFEIPTHAGSTEDQSWLIGDINKLNILGDEYNVQGMIISTLFDPMPKYYISFERLVCENQFGQLGKNSSSMYIDMNAFLQTRKYTQEDKDKLASIIMKEVEKRMAEAQKVYEKLATTHLTDAQINTMFEKLTIDTVAKQNEERYHEQEIRLAHFLGVYNNNDNQNFKNSLFGFVNACTNVRTREKTNPLDVIKPVLPAQVIESPCNFEYLCRAALVNAA